MKRFFSPMAIQPDNIIGVVRIVLGALLIFHGKEIFDADLMNGYLQWDMFKKPHGKLLVYFGKTSEFIAGILLFLGFFTRFSAVVIICTFSYITFIVGQGRFWYEEQHPFMFLIFGILFLFIGPGKWSLDGIIFNRLNNQ